MKTLGECLTLTLSSKKWYEEFPKSDTISSHSKSEEAVMNLKDEAKGYLAAEAFAYQLKQSKIRNSEYSWLKTALSQGTSSDKIVASVVLIQESPKYNLSQLSVLVGQVKAAKQNHCTMIITALRDLFLSDLLHPNHKLVKFENQNLDKIDDLDNIKDSEKETPLISKKKLLAHWYFEDQLRDLYEKFIVSLSQIALNTVDANREKVVAVMNDLLMGNPEQEHKLLDLLINKIGDPSNKVASKVTFCLKKLLFEHSNMKIVVLREIEKLLFRNNVSSRAQYYSICLLTQFVLSHDDIEVANSLIDVYFAFFKACLKNGEPDSRMMAAILTGVNRAYRFTKIEPEKLKSHIDSLFKVVHVGSFNVSLNALNLLFQVIEKEETQSNRFHCAIYRKLLDPQIAVANKRAVFLNLLFRVMKNDPSIIRLQAFIKRIFQGSLYYPANMTCATLYVVSQVLKSRKDVKYILTPLKIKCKSEAVEEAEVKIDLDINNEKNEILVENQNNIVLSNITLNNSESTPKVAVVDIKKESEFKEELDTNRKYDPFCRNPLGSAAYNSSSYELFALMKHFHPSVALFARNIIEGNVIDYTGDPLEDLNLIRFLDRYVYKNPKKLENKNYMRKGDPLAQRASYTPQGVRSIPVDSEAYLNEPEHRIPVDELFLYQFLKRKHVTRVKHQDTDNESVTSEDFNDMLDSLAKRMDFDELNIAGDIDTTKHKRKGKCFDDNEKDVSEENSTGDDFDDMEEIDWIEDLENEEKMMEGDISDEGTSDEDTFREGIFSLRKTGEKSKKEMKGPEDNIFVSAEKFAEMMEEQGLSKQKHGGSSSFSTMDGANIKQLDWESKRNQQLSGSFNNKKRKKATNFKRCEKKKKLKRQKC